MWILYVEHCALQEDIIFAEVLAGADVVGTILILVLLIVVLLVVVRLRSRLKAAVLVQIFWRTGLDFYFPFESL